MVQESLIGRENNLRGCDFTSNLNVDCFWKKRTQLEALRVSVCLENVCALDLSVPLELKGRKFFFYVFQWFFSISNNTLVVPWLEPGTAYCVSAQIHVTTPILDSGFSKEHCITTLKGMCEVENLKKRKRKCKLEKIIVIEFVSLLCILFESVNGFSFLCPFVSMNKTLPLIKHSWD